MTTTTQKKPPVIVVLGHVDHGKTTLLDTIRKTQVTQKEFGGITQHIGAYEITTQEGKKITFIDTPGHEAFSNLRQRGARVADIAVLLVAADSSVQPQTVEALDVIKKANIPFIVAINKIDLPAARVEKVIKNLAKHEVYLEGHGGDIPFAAISAQKGEGIDKLLELLSLVAELSELSFSPNAQPEGVVIEVKKDRRGVVLSIILKNGTLKVGDTIFVGAQRCRVRSLTNDRGEQVKEITPSTPTEMLGAKTLIEPGTIIATQPVEQASTPSVESEKVSSDFAADFFKEEKKTFNFIIKTDVSGTEEVIRKRFGEFEEIRIIRSEVGELTDADVELAVGSKANILLFNVPLKKNIAHKAEAEGVTIFQFNLIYELLDQVEELIYSLREKEEKEARKIGEARVLAEFTKDAVRIAGMRVLSGAVRVNAVAEFIRGKKNLGETTIKSLYQKSNAVLEVKRGEECGAVFSPQLDFKQGDIVKLYLS